MQQLEDAVRQYYRKVRSRFSSIVCDANTADDLSQEVFARLCNTLREGSDVRNLWGFLAGIMHNVWLEHLRSRSKWSPQLSRNEEIGDVADPRSGASVDSVQLKDTQKRMRECLYDLEAEERAIIVGLYYFGMTGEELARWLDQPRKTLLDRHERTMRKLRSTVLSIGLV